MQLNKGDNLKIDQINKPLLMGDIGFKIPNKKKVVPSSPKRKDIDRFEKTFLLLDIKPHEQMLPRDASLTHFMTTRGGPNDYKSEERKRLPIPHPVFDLKELKKRLINKENDKAKFRKEHLKSSEQFNKSQEMLPNREIHHTNKANIIPKVSSGTGSSKNPMVTTSMILADKSKVFSGRYTRIGESMNTSKYQFENIPRSFPKKEYGQKSNFQKGSNNLF
jgi:hypothetical protein